MAHGRTTNEPARYNGADGIYGVDEPQEVYIVL